MFEEITSQQEKPKSFEEQWANPKKLTLAGEEVEVYDIKPEKEGTPVPIWFACGWTGTPEMYRENIHALVARGRRVISINAPHGVDFKKETIVNPDPKNVPDALFRKIAGIIKTIEKKGIANIDVVGHSEGCMDTVLAASLYPDKFRNIVLVNPAGLIGKDTTPRLMIGFISDIIMGNIRELRVRGISEPLRRANRELVYSILRGPIRSFKEVFAIANTQTHSLLTELRDKGIKIYIICAYEDRAFPANRIEKIVAKDVVFGFRAIPGTHNQFIFEAEKHNELVINALATMEI